MLKPKHMDPANVVRLPMVSRKCLWATGDGAINVTPVHTATS